MAEKDASLQKINKLIKLMKDNELVELEIADGDSKIHLKRPSAEQPIVTQIPTAPATAVPTEDNQQPPAAETQGLVDILSPIIGTFYTAPSPDSEPYVKVGSDVNPEMVVCIVEAMKVLNEIKAETSGTIAKIMVSNGEAVEYGQVLFKVRPH